METASLEASLISGLPSSGYYIPDFITEEEEKGITNELLRTPPAKWTNLSHRRLLSLPSPLTGTSRDTLIASPLPVHLSKPILPRLAAMGIFSRSPHGAPNHVLVNEYKQGEGIMPHEDGPAYFPITATVSLGGYTVLDVYKKNAEGEREVMSTWRILQEPRSLLLTTSEMYADTLHGIAEVTTDQELGPDTIINWSRLGNREPYESGKCERQTRVSLTYRDVMKVTKLGGAMKFMGKR